jgi:signal transduction histidine kinase
LRHGGGNQIEVAIGRTGKDALLTVSDNGRGIAAEERELVLQRFYRSTPGDQEHDGTAGSGLGLSIVKRIIELHDGRLEIESPATGTGTNCGCACRLLADGRRPGPAARA